MVWNGIVWFLGRFSFDEFINIYMDSFTFDLKDWLFSCLIIPNERFKDI